MELEKVKTVSEQIKDLQQGIKHLVIKKPEFMTYQAAAEYMGKTPTAIRIMVCRGYLTVIKNGGYRYLRTADLDDFISGKLENGKRHQDRDNKSDKAASDLYPQAQKSL